MTRTKAEWRRVLLDARKAIAQEARPGLNAAMLGHVERLDGLEAACCILGYVAIGAEADPSVLLQRVSERGVPVFVPASTEPDRAPTWRECHVGLPIPTDSERFPESLPYPALVLVPGVGFDHSGVRLGRGRGYFDRALADLRNCGDTRAVGLAFECQIVPRLPEDAWDQRVDMVVSESGIFIPPIESDSPPPLWAR